jgi:hypothetical protein
MENVNQKLARILDIQKELDLRKALYAELDALVLELQAGGFRSADLEGMRLELVDNFAEGKNTVFRPAGVKRFEIEIEPVEKALKREAKKSKTV